MPCHFQPHTVENLRVHGVTAPLFWLQHLEKACCVKISDGLCRYLAFRATLGGARTQRGAQRARRFKQRLSAY